MGALMHIFHVEDDQNDVLLLEAVIRQSKLPLRFQTIRCGAEAAKQLASLAGTSSQLPDLFLLDIKVPNVTGLELLKQIRNTAAFNAIPAVMLTTSNHHSDIQAARQLHANAYMVKPTSIDELREFLTTLYADFTASRIPSFWPDELAGSTVHLPLTCQVN